MTTLPLLWAETEDVGELLRSDASSSWVRDHLELRYALEPLDTLDAAALARLDRLILAQPRALSPEENVALDGWVRSGGRLLLVADPMLTRHSRFALGDKRRPQDVALLSPILAHWGLELRFDESQTEGERTVRIADHDVPVDVAGYFVARPAASCSLSGKGLLASCRIGKGYVIALADAALLDDAEQGADDARRASLSRLAALAFD